MPDQSDFKAMLTLTIKVFKHKNYNGGLQLLLQNKTSLGRYFSQEEVQTLFALCTIFSEINVQREKSISLLAACSGKPLGPSGSRTSKVRLSPFGLGGGPNRPVNPLSQMKAELTVLEKNVTRQ